MLYDDSRNSPKATFTQVPNRNAIKPVRFLKRKFACVHRGQSVFVPVLVLFTIGYTIVSVVNTSHQNKQKKSHLLTKFVKHHRTRGKFILPNLKSIGKIVESFAFKIYQIVVCLQGSRQQTLLEKESFVKYQENENLQ